MEIPVYSGNQICGTLRTERKGLYTLFDGTVETDSVCRLVAVFEGGEVPLGIPAPEQADGEYRVYGPDGEFLMLGEVRGQILRTVKSFFEVK